MRIVSELVALVVPPLCAACRGPVTDASALVCSRCLRELSWIGSRGCRRCGLPSHRGRVCPATTAAFATAWAPVAYLGTARSFVHALKFRGALPVASLMGAQLAANAPPWAVAGATGVVAVPPAPRRRRRRGFDPAGLLAAELARRLDLPLETGCLRRRGEAPRQVGARRSERRASGRVAVEVTRDPPAVALLVDDVHTTGATLDACARVLRAAGTRHVHAVTYARAL